MSVNLLAGRIRPSTLYYGDCLDVMKEWDDRQVDLIYLDPPFNSDVNYNMLFGSETDGTSGQFMAFSDTWQWDAGAAERVRSLSARVVHPVSRVIEGLERILGQSGMLAYVSYMAERLIECHRLLKPSGSIYLHCDPHASHYLKVVMDGIFGASVFQNEIIWQRTRGRSDANPFGRVHDVILFYAGKGHTAHRQYTKHNPAYLARTYRHRDAIGRYRAADLTASGPRSGESGKPWRGIDPGKNHWRTPTRGGMNDFIPGERPRAGVATGRGARAARRP